jgi:ankyrin repeat protein
MSGAKLMESPEVDRIYFFARGSGSSRQWVRFIRYGDGSAAVRGALDFTSQGDAEGWRGILQRIHSEHFLFHSAGPTELSAICAEQNPDPKDQRLRLVTLLKAGADVHATDRNGVTALHHAVRFRNPLAVKTLIEYGASVNQVCRKSGSTPLHRAVTSTGAPSTAGKQSEAREIITLLLAAGADTSIRNKLGKTPRDYASDEGIQALLVGKPKKGPRRT